MIILPQMPLYVIAIICGLLSFSVTRLFMPKIIQKLEEADIVGKDIHKSWKPVVAEMGGFGIIFGFVIGMFSGIYMHDILAFPLLIVLVVILLVGMIGILVELLALSSKSKFFLLFFNIKNLLRLNYDINSSYFGKTSSVVPYIFISPS